MRCFVAVDFPKEIIREIANVQANLSGIPGLSLARGFHLTLKFLGEIDEKQLEKVRAALAGVRAAPFEARLSEIGFFPNIKKPRVIWVGAESEGFYSINSAVESALAGLGFKREKFSSHITLARVKYIGDRTALDSALSKIRIEKMRFSVSSFSLKKSVLAPNGPIYSDIASFQLNL
ncbi:MAG: RNA 2',3'-cyclic phosphodiesterase [Candidatus Woesearchaeota archaeon]|nr:RNA 2',3'-cyclic phosphodiesterase [Candidatus Woesearchaeota archaeon]